jgi:hypothetical protein
MATIKLIGIPSVDPVPGTVLEPFPGILISGFEPTTPVPKIFLRIHWGGPPALQVALREGLMRGIARGLLLREIPKKTWRR